MESGDHNQRPTTELTNLGPMDFSYESDDFQFEDEDVKPDVNRLETSSASSGPEQTNVQVNKRKKKKPKRVQPSTSMSVGIHRTQKRSGLRSLGQELRRQEKYAKAKLCIHRRPFQRLVRQISYEFKENLRFQSSAIDALREATEHYLVELFEKSSWCAAHGKRVTIQPKDMLLVLKITQDPYLLASSTDKE